MDYLKLKYLTMTTKYTTILIFMLLFFTSLSYSQSTTKEDLSIFKKISIKEVVTVQLIGKNYDLTTLENLKTDLLMYEEKILGVVIEPTSKLMSITYNGFMQQYDFEKAFSKNNISYYSTLSNSSIQTTKSTN